MQIRIDSPEEKALKAGLETRHDPEAERIKRFLTLPDLSRTAGSPLKEIVDRTLKVKSLEGFDVIEIPEIIPTNILFDLFNMPEGHPARSKSDTYYVDETNVLRTHDTVFWYYYLNHPEIKKRIENGEAFGAICHGTETLAHDGTLRVSSSLAPGRRLVWNAERRESAAGI